VATEPRHTVVCRFEGDPLLEAVPTTLRLNLGRITPTSNRLAPTLQVYANQRFLGEVVSFRQKPGEYEFLVPQLTWLQGANSIYLSFVSNRDASLDPLIAPDHRLLVRRVSLEF
jgi:hypothetical protein